MHLRTEFITAILWQEQSSRKLPIRSIQQDFSVITRYADDDNVKPTAPEAGNGYREDINEVLGEL